MLINILQKNGDLYDLSWKEDQILEIYHVDHKPADLLRLCVYDPASNTLEEIAKNERKVAFIKINVSYKPCAEVYYATYQETEDKMIEIHLLAYHLKTKKTRTVCSFPESKSVLTSQKIVRAFILSPSDVLIQTEIVNKKESSNLMGSIVFTQTMYSADLPAPLPVVEENFINNGINAIIPMNESEILVKTGFSFLEDSRLSIASKNDALIESVYRTTSQKLIGDLKLSLTNIDMYLITTTYFDKYILRPEIIDEFIVFNTIDVAAKTSESRFINYVTDEKFTVQNNDIDLTDLRVAYVVNNDPYIRRTKGGKSDFVNVRTAENDISFVDDTFITVLGKLFILESKNKKHTNLKLYNYPKMDIVLDAKYTYIAGIHNNEQYFLYTE